MCRYRKMGLRVQHPEPRAQLLRGNGSTRFCGALRSREALRRGSRRILGNSLVPVLNVTINCVIVRLRMIVSACIVLRLSTTASFAPRKSKLQYFRQVFHHYYVFNFVFLHASKSWSTRPHSLVFAMHRRQTDVACDGNFDTTSILLYSQMLTASPPLYHSVLCITARHVWFSW